MISKKLNARTIFVKGAPLPNRAQSSAMHRRGQNHVVLEEEDPESGKFDTFFDYEDDLANLKPSSEQYAEMINEDPFVMLEERALEKEEASSVVMEEIGEPTNKSLESNKKRGYRDVVGFAFVQCNFVKKDGVRCKRQAPTGKEICSTHKRFVEKHGVEH
jgi:hypothetical protein